MLMILQTSGSKIPSEEFSSVYKIDQVPINLICVQLDDN